MAQKKATVAVTITSSEQPSSAGTGGGKVTLTNWKRVANSPFNIASDRPVQAVHWCDYVVLFDVREKEMYLYHHRCGIWSAVYNSFDDLRQVSTSMGCLMPVAVLKQDLILLSSKGEIYKFILKTGHWKIDDFLRIQDDRLENQHFKIKSSSQSTSSLINCNDVILLSTFDQQSLIALLQTTKNREEHLYLKQFRDSRWLGAKELQRAFFTNKTTRVSYALSNSNLYVNTDFALYHIDTDKAEKVMVTEISLPSLNKFTICAANDTVFSFGGVDEDGQPSSDVNRYNPATNEWEPAGYMRSCRYSVVVSSFQRDEVNTDIIVVGGVLGEINQPRATLTCRIAEICEAGISVR